MRHLGNAVAGPVRFGPVCRIRQQPDRHPIDANNPALTGLFYGGGTKVLLAQGIGSLIVCAATFATVMAVFYVLNFMERTVDAIMTAARSEPGRIGDGKIFVMSLEDCYRIRTGEEGNVAIGP